jgi:hypothetical protein
VTLLGQNRESSSIAASAASGMPHQHGVERIVVGSNRVKTGATNEQEE